MTTDLLSQGALILKVSTILALPYVASILWRKFILRRHLQNALRQHENTRQLISEPWVVQSQIPIPRRLEAFAARHQKNLTASGFRFLTCFHRDQLSRGRARTTGIVYVSADGLTVASCAAATVPRYIKGLALRIPKPEVTGETLLGVDLQTLFSNGTILVSTNQISLGMANIEGLVHQSFRPSLPLPELFALHFKAIPMLAARLPAKAEQLTTESDIQRLLSVSASHIQEHDLKLFALLSSGKIGGWAEKFLGLGKYVAEVRTPSQDKSD